MAAQFVTRRVFLRSATLLGFASAAALSLGWDVLANDPEPQIHLIENAKSPATAQEDAHLANLRLPIIADDGANVPIIISMDHPMEADHYIKSIQMLNFNDPIVSKGIYRFTPANGEAYLSTQIRMDAGDMDIFVIAECSQHGKWATKATLQVGLGGCSS